VLRRKIELNWYVGARKWELDCVLCMSIVSAPFMLVTYLFPYQNIAVGSGMDG